MFGKDQPDVVTEQDVGDYIEELKRQGTKEINDFVMEVPGDLDTLVGVSEKMEYGQSLPALFREDFAALEEIVIAKVRSEPAGRSQMKMWTFIELYGSSSRIGEHNELVRDSSESTDGRESEK